jgi:hypothetical protein
MSKSNIHCFVPHNLRRVYEETGWQYVGQDDGYSSCYVWAGEGRPVFPETPETRAHAVAEFDAVFGPPSQWEDANG